MTLSYLLIRLLFHGTAGIYDGRTSKTPRTKAEIRKLQPKLAGAWENYLSARSGKIASNGKGIVSALRAGRGGKAASRESAIVRLSNRSMNSRKDQ